MDIERPALDVGRSGRAITESAANYDAKVPIFSQAWAGERQITPDQSRSGEESPGRGLIARTAFIVT